MAKVAIIGGGVSALFLSCFLKGRGWDIDIYEEKAVVGGNCLTVDLDVGGLMRWADIGVNDFNQPMYQEVYNFMQALGVEALPLEDTSSFFTRDSKLTYTVDGGYKTPMPQSFSSQYSKFQNDAPRLLADPSLQGKSIRDALAENGYSEEFIKQCILPRVNAMYFSDDRDVGSMPIQAVLHYYVLQEGFGTEKPVLRRYFRHGTRVWINRLRTASGANFFENKKVEVKATDGRPRVVLPPAASGEKREEKDYDAVVFACHANQARDALKWEKGVKEDEQLTRLLGKIKYVQSTGYVHTFAELLAKEKRAWRTYNVLIRDYNKELETPYSITYVINHHQADSLNDYDNYFEAEQYFVTLNPFIPIPEEYILKQRDTGASAWHFPHNVVNKDCMNAQRELWAENNPIQGRRNIYFTGGWTLGAGLHIECWESAKEIAKLLNGKRGPSEMTYESGRPVERFAPKYIRRIVGMAE